MKETEPRRRLEGENTRMIILVAVCAAIDGVVPAVLQQFSLSLGSRKYNDSKSTVWQSLLYGMLNVRIVLVCRQTGNNGL